jgi:hypothetical protein
MIEVPFLLTMYQYRYELLNHEEELGWYYYFYDEIG